MASSGDETKYLSDFPRIFLNTIVVWHFADQITRELLLTWLVLQFFQTGSERIWKATAPANFEMRLDGTLERTKFFRERKAYRFRMFWKESYHSETDEFWWAHKIASIGCQKSESKDELRHDTTIRSHWANSGIIKRSSMQLRTKYWRSVIH